MSSGISLIVCCYNSSKRISETLRHIAAQKVDASILWEVIIVDNSSQDDTASIAKEIWNGYETAHISFRVVFEPNAGLMNARKKGIDESQYEFLLFCDDDNWLDRNYVAKAFSIMNSNAAIGVLAGRIEAVSDAPIPFWFSTYQKSYAVGVLAIDSGDVSEGRHVWGAGMIFRKSTYQKLIASGFKHSLMGRQGNNLYSGEDGEICVWHLLVGLKLWYSEDLILGHFMTTGRLTKEYFKKMKDGQSAASLITHQYYHILSAFNDPLFFSKVERAKNKLKYFYFKYFRRGDVPFDLTSTMQIYCPNRSYNEFTKEVLIARKKYMEQR